MKHRFNSKIMAIILVACLILPSMQVNAAGTNGKPKKSSITSVKLDNANTSKCMVKINVKKARNAGGVQVKVATNKKFKKAKTKKSKSGTVLMGAISPNKTYYVKVRSYKKSGKVRYSGWSKVKKFRFTMKDIQNFRENAVKSQTPQAANPENSTDGTDDTTPKCQHTKRTSYTDIDRGEVYGGEKKEDEEYYPRVIFCHFCYKGFLRTSGNSHECIHWFECSHNTPEYRLQSDGFVHGTGLGSWGTIAYYVKGYRVAPKYQDVTTTKKTYCNGCKKLLSKETKTEKTTVSEETFEPIFLEDGSVLPTKNGYNESKTFKMCVKEHVDGYNSTKEKAEHEWSHVNEAYTGIYWE